MQNQASQTISGSDAAPAYAIQIEGLRKTYRPSAGAPAKEALRGVDLKIRAGSVFGLLGPNGAGKSTLINILAGLVVKTEGSVRIWGFDQDQNPRQSRAAIGVMPQELNLDAFFTPRGSLDVQAGLYGVPRRERRTDEILAMVGLIDKADAYARSLSGGMRRRLLLGKALVHRPRILVLDEPTAGVDVELRQMLWNNIRKLNAEEGTTIILTTHYLEEAEEMCDEIAIIDQGGVIAQDSTARLLDRLDTKTMVIAPVRPVEAVPAMPNGVRGQMKDGAIHLTWQRSSTKASQIFAALSEARVEISDITTSEPHLEEVFLALTQKPG